MRKLNRKKRANFDKRQALLLFVVLGLVIGIIIGCIMSISMSQTSFNELKGSIQDYFRGFLNNNMNSYSLFKSGFFKYIKLVVIIWILGFVKIGGILIFLLILFRGLSYGYTTAFFFTVYGLSGIVVASILYLPQFVILVPTYLYISYKSISYNLLNRNLEKQRDIKSLIMYFKILLIATACVAIACVVEAFIIPQLIYRMV